MGTNYTYPVQALKIPLQVLLKYLDLSLLVLIIEQATTVL